MDERIEVLESRIGELEKQFTEMNKMNCCTKSEHGVNAILQNVLDLTRVKRLHPILKQIVKSIINKQS